MFVSAVFGLLALLLALAGTRDLSILKTLRNVSSTSMENNDHFKDQILDYHNLFREQHGAENLSWNASIARMAEDWASNCNFKHSVIASKAAREARNLLTICCTASRTEPRRRIPRCCALY